MSEQIKESTTPYEKIQLTTLDLYQFKCDETLIDRALDDIKKSPIVWDHYGNDPLDNTTGSLGYMNKEATESYYHEELFTWVQGCIDTVAAIHYPNKKLTISDSWPTKNKFGTNARPHWHACSIVSGLLYLTTHTKSETNFIFSDPWQEPYNLFRLIDNKVVKISPEKGKLIIFMSNMMHSVETHTDLKNPNRYTMAFNTFFTGVVSDSVSGKLNLTVHRS